MDNIQIWLTLGAALAFGIFLMRGGFAKKIGGKSDADPLAEAEVYIAYGRDKQAVEILTEALRKDPSRADIAARLRELSKK